MTKNASPRNTLPNTNRAMRRNEIQHMIRQVTVPPYTGPLPCTRIYHGTASRFLPSILRQGIVPRDDRASQWQAVPSRQDLVYLTTTYPAFYALNAATKENMEIVLLEIDFAQLDRRNLYPDEDFLYCDWTTQFGRCPKVVADALRGNLEHFRGAWAQSIIHLGNCSHRGTIPPGAITRYAIVDCRKRAEFQDIVELDIQPLTHTLCGERYRRLLSWVFDDTSQHPNVGSVKEMLPHVIGPALSLDGESLAFWKKAEVDRDGITVVSRSNVGNWPSPRQRHTPPKSSIAFSPRICCKPRWQRRF